jgi:pimeloyl-ACP methyl ester carboxylesterase
MQFLTKSVALATGATLAYIEKGAVGGLPIVFLHGLTDSHRSYEPVLEILPDRYHAFALTARGHGDSSRPATGYTPEDMAADVAAFMDALGIEKAVIAGHSMSSMVARAFAHRHPERVLGLVLMGAFASLHASSMAEELAQAVNALGEEIPEELAREFQLSSLAKPAPPAFLDMAVAETLKVPAFVFKAALAGLMDRDRTFVGSGLMIPTLIAWGDRETMAPRSDQDVLLKAFRNAKLVVFAGGGHAFHWESPAMFVSELVAWLRNVEHLRGKAAA